jgi:hypothetical protein
MEIFDGFIAAVASEFKIKFQKTKNGIYDTKIEFDNGRSQHVMVALSFDESGDRLINYYSVIEKIPADTVELFQFSLKMNATIDYGAIALMDDTLILRNTLLLEDCDPHQFVKSLIYIAAKADELEEQLTSKDEA